MYGTHVSNFTSLSCSVTPQSIILTLRVKIQSQDKQATKYTEINIGSPPQYIRGCLKASNYIGSLRSHSYTQHARFVALVNYIT